MTTEGDKLSNKKVIFSLYAAWAASLVGLALVVSALCWLWLRYTIIREVHSDIGAELLFLLVNTHSLSLLAGWLIIFFARFFRRRVENRIDGKSVRRTRRVFYALSLLAALAVFVHTLIMPELTEGMNENVPGGIKVPGVELNSPMNATFTREAIGSRPAFEVSTNAYGFRDRPFDVEADSGRTRIMLVGDSFVFGSGISQNECLAPQLETELNGRLRGITETRVYAVAQEGWNLEQEVSAITAMSPILKPDIVIIGHMPGNDLWPYDPMFRKRWQKQIFQNEIREMRIRQIETFRDREYTVPELTLNFHRQMRKLSDWAQEQGIDVFFYTYGLCSYQLEKYLESGRVFLQHFPDWLLDDANFIPGDGHPSRHGNLVMARMLAPFVMEVLQQRNNEKSSGFNLKARLAMQSMWPQPCSPLGKVSYETVWVIPQDRTPLVRDLLEEGWFTQHGLKHLESMVNEEIIRLVFADSEGRDFSAVLRKKCNADGCNVCADACVCFEGSFGDTAELQNYICSRLPGNLWEEKKRPMEINERGASADGMEKGTLKESPQK